MPAISVLNLSDSLKMALGITSIDSVTVIRNEATGNIVICPQRQGVILASRIESSFRFCSFEVF